MNKTIFPVLLILLLGISACSSVQVSTTPVSNDLPIASKLVVGTLKLKDTEQAVTSEQAKDLLVMWQVYQDLSNSDTAAQAEIDGLVEQIRGTLTTDQMNAIQAMNLTQQDVFATMQEQGGDFMQVRQSSGSSSSTQSGGGMPGGAGGHPGGGDIAGGAPPDGGMGGIGGTGASTGTDGTQASGTRPGTGGSMGVPAPLVNALIQYLEQIASA